MSRGLFLLPCSNNNYIETEVIIMKEDEKKMLMRMEAPVSFMYRMLEVLNSGSYMENSETDTEIQISGTIKYKDMNENNTHTITMYAGNIISAFSNYRYPVNDCHDQRARCKDEFDTYETLDSAIYDILVLEETSGFFNPTPLIETMLPYLNSESDKIVSLIIYENEVSLFIYELGNDGGDGTEIIIPFESE
jgi:hypothetical protein